MPSDEVTISGYDVHSGQFVETVISVKELAFLTCCFDGSWGERLPRFPVIEMDLSPDKESSDAP